MPEIHHFGQPRLLSKVTHAPVTLGRLATSEHETRLTLSERFQEFAVVVDVVFKVRILYQDKVTRRFLEAATDGVALTLGRLLEDH